MDALDNLRAFVATAEAGSFSQAARQLGLVPSTRPKRASTLPSAHGQSRTDRCRTIRYVASSAACVRHPHT
ncbi:MAG TPA: LysR family transcriptional regulator, partial [Burkholderiaceae bacterium]|nr:LysR family transcriptional regulator [Burkholderiaceae bacterium]